MTDWLEVKGLPFMNAEGCSEEEPTEECIRQKIKRRGYDCKNVSISYDDFQQMWRFTARLIKTD